MSILLWLARLVQIKRGGPRAKRAKNSTIPLTRLQTDCMRHCSKRAVYIVAAVCIFSAAFFWFCILPGKLFSLGMTLSDIQNKVGGHCQVIPLGTALSHPPTQFELANTPRYQVRVRAMLVDVFLNSRKEAVRIRSVFWTKGTLTLTIPSAGADSTNSP